MKVIILKTQEIKEVSLGYAVNYLLPKKLAVIATEAKIKELEKEAEKRKVANAETAIKDREQAERLNGKVVEFKGKVTKKELAEKLKVDKSKIELKRSITKPGEYNLELSFGEAKAKIKLKVKP